MGNPEAVKPRPSIEIDGADLIARGPGGLRASRFRLDREELAVLSFPLPRAVLPDALTDAEREVAQGILDCKSNAAIASERGTSARTVANQAAAIFRKCNVRSRGELVAVLARTSDGSG